MQSQNEDMQSRNEAACSHLDLLHKSREKAGKKQREGKGWSTQARK